MLSLKIKDHRIERKICNRFCFTLFEAVNEPDNQKRFLKILDPTFARDEACVFRYLNGARLASRVQNDQVCQIFQFSKEDNRYIIISEHVAADTLETRIHKDFPMPLERLTTLIISLASVLREVHLQGVVHGLLNPGSIYLMQGDRIKLDDLVYNWIVPDLFKREDTEGMYLTNYMAPEVYFGHDQIDGRADIYSLGAIFLQLLAEENFNCQVNTSLKHNQLIGAISQIRNQFWQHAGALESILAKCLGMNPDFRYQNLKDLLKDLETLKREVADAAREDCKPVRD